MERDIPKTLLPAHGRSETVRIDPVDPFKVVDDSRCFLCGEEYTQGERTDEHVFPRWLLAKYDLWQQKLNLLNDTEIPYAQIRIPCCRRCNGDHLGKLESTVEQAVTAGFDEFVKLPDAVVFQWLTKIFVEILRLETRLLKDRSDRDAGFIVPQEMLDEFKFCHWLLSSVRRPIQLQIADGQLWSIFRFRCQEATKDRKLNFDFMDNVGRLGVAIRMGQVGIVAALQDCGANWYLGKRYFGQIARALSLHPYQFREIACMVFYKQHTMTRVPKFMTLLDPTPTVIALPLQGLSRVPIFGDWDQRMYAAGLAKYLPVEFDLEAAERGQARTFIKAPDGRYLHIPIDDPKNSRPVGAKRRRVTIKKRRLSPRRNDTTAGLRHVARRRRPAPRGGRRRR